MSSLHPLLLSLSLATTLAGGPAMALADSTPADPQAERLAARFAETHRLIAPAPGESKWATVPWMPSTDLWAARKKAAKEGKPLFLWYMAGDPLGVC